MNDVSVGCALGASMVCQHGSCTSRTRSASSLVTVDDCLLAGRLGVLSLPVWDSNTLPKGNDFK